MQYLVNYSFGRIKLMMELYPYQTNISMY